MLDNHMKYKDLRDFIALLEQRGLLKRITQEIDPYLEMTEIADRTLRAGGPALLFENPKGYGIPVLANLFGTPERVALGMGQEEVSALRQVGEWMAMLKEPEPPKGLRDLMEKLPVFKQVFEQRAAAAEPRIHRGHHRCAESRDRTERRIRLDRTLDGRPRDR